MIRATQIIVSLASIPKDCATIEDPGLAGTEDSGRAGKYLLSRAKQNRDHRNSIGGK